MEFSWRKLWSTPIPRGPGLFGALLAALPAAKLFVGALDWISRFETVVRVIEFLDSTLGASLCLALGFVLIAYAIWRGLQFAQIKPTPETLPVVGSEDALPVEERRETLKLRIQEAKEELAIVRRTTYADQNQAQARIAELETALKQGQGKLNLSVQGVTMSHIGRDAIHVAGSAEKRAQMHKCRHCGTGIGVPAVKLEVGSVHPPISCPVCGKLDWPSE